MLRDSGRIQRLVGSITEHDLEHVDCAVCDSFGVLCRVPDTAAMLSPKTTRTPDICSSSS